jgi:tetratricopeptide (TPR) repeat protein
MRRTTRSSTALLFLLFIAGTVPAQRATDSAAAGEEALRNQQYHEAVELFSRAAEANPNYADAHRGLAEAFYWLEEYDQALVHIEEANRLARRNTRVLNLLGRIAIGLGDLDRAESAFRQVQEIEANNVDARIGLAELSLAKGQAVEAAGYLETALRRNPGHRKALLSLVLIYEQLGEPDVAAQYLDLALQVHRDAPEVHVLASEYYLRRGDVERAAAEARLAQALDSQNRSATVLRARTALLQERFDEALVTSEELLGVDRRDERAWYLRAVALTGLADYDDALDSYATALRVAPDDGLIRIAAEHLALETLDLGAPFRQELADYRASQAASAVSGYRHAVALAEYQRALQLAPLDPAIRQSYAEVHLVMGNRATYLEELRLLQEDTPDCDRAVQIEVYENALSESVAVAWGLDQFTLTRSPVTVALFLDTSESDLEYPALTEPLLAFVDRSMRRQERFSVVSSQEIASFSAAYAQARSEGVDYFILLDVSATPRTTHLRAQVYVGRTGTRTDTIVAVRTGERRTSAAVDSFVADCARILPCWYHIVARSGRQIVIDGGRRSDLAIGDELLVFAPGEVQLEPASSSLSFSPDRAVGTCTITRIDDLVAEASLTLPGLLDRVRIGDMVTMESAEQAESTGGTVLFPALYDRVRQLR